MQDAGCHPQISGSLLERGSSEGNGRLVLLFSTAVLVHVSDMFHISFFDDTRRLCTVNTQGEHRTTGEHKRIGCVLMGVSPSL